MEGLLERISAARKRVKDLLEERSRTAKELEAMEARSREGSREAEVLKARIKELEQENEVLRTLKAAAAQPEGAGAKEKIDELVNEIDQCLALLKA